MSLLHMSFLLHTPIHEYRTSQPLPSLLLTSPAIVTHTHEVRKFLSSVIKCIIAESVKAKFFTSFTCACIQHYSTPNVCIYASTTAPQTCAYMLELQHPKSVHICRVGQNHISAPYMTVCIVISLLKILYVYTVYTNKCMVLANPTYMLALLQHPKRVHIC